MENKLKIGFRSFMTEIVKYPKWSTNDFEKAKKLLYLDYPEPYHLWQEIRESDFSIFN